MTAVPWRGPWGTGELRGKEVDTQMTNLYLAFMNLITRDEEGQGLAEYALILALIAIVAIIALIFLGGQVSKILSTVGNSV
jgi:pilus assembly protein Flp/PilA